MLRILLIWSKENTDTSYRQGMHELLAPIVLVVHREARTQKDVQDEISKSSEQSTFDQQWVDFLRLLLDSNSVEHDAYMMFSVLMRSMKAFFQVVELPKRVCFFF